MRRAARRGAVGELHGGPGNEPISEFTGVQAGAEFKGSFHKFTAAVDFSPDALADARIDVVDRHEFRGFDG